MFHLGRRSPCYFNLFNSNRRFFRLNNRRRRGEICNRNFFNLNFRRLIKPFRLVFDYSINCTISLVWDFKQKQTIKIKKKVSAACKLNENYHSAWWFNWPTKKRQYHNQRSIILNYIYCQIESKIAARSAKKTKQINIKPKKIRYMH